jgi:hypothetical protein
MEPFDSHSFRDRIISLYSLSFNEKLFEILDTGKLVPTALTDINRYIKNYIIPLSRTAEEKKTLLEMLENIISDTKQNSKGDTGRYYSFLDELLERKRSKIKMIGGLFIENGQPPVETHSMNLSQEELDEYIFEDFTSVEPTLTPTNLFYTFDLNIFIKDRPDIVFKGEGPESSKSKTSLGGGTFGMLYSYSSESLQRDGSKFNYVVKFARLSEDGTIDDGNERKANQALRSILREQKRRCDIIHGRVITCSSENHLAILMPMMDGDISKLNMRGWSKMSKLKLLDTIRSQMECIIKLNSDEDLENPLQNTFKFAYLDLKPGNILYKRRANGELTYKLGDLGSIVEDDEKNRPGEFISTYPVHIFEKKEGKLVLVNGKNYQTLQFPGRHIVKCMRYVFGILAHIVLGGILIKSDGIYKKILSTSELQLRNQKIIEYYGDDYSDLMYDTSTEPRLSMYN